MNKRHVSKNLEDAGHDEGAPLILSAPTQISFLSFRAAVRTPSERTARKTICAVTWRSKEVRGRWMEKFVLPRSLSTY